MAETNAAREAREAKQNDPTIEQESGEVIAADTSGVIQPATVERSDMVTVTLAHPLTRKQDLIYLGLDPSKSYGVNDEVPMLRNAAESLINAGMVQVDPTDRAAVDNVLGVHPKTDA